MAARGAEVVPMRGREAVPTPDMSGWPYYFDLLALDKLDTAAYQRPLTPIAKRIERKFNMKLVGVIYASTRSAGRYAVMDGQNRAAGMRALGLLEIPALVFPGLTLEDEAELFSLLQTERQGLSSADRFRADVIRKEPHALGIMEVMEGLGFFPAAAKNRTAGAISAMTAVEFVWHGCSRGDAAKQSEHPELLAKTLEVIKDSWPRRPVTATSAVMIKGLGYFLSETDPAFAKKIDTERLVNRLQRVDPPSKLLDAARLLRDGKGESGSSPTHMAEAIHFRYKGR
jgi:hypothetical protein